MFISVRCMPRNEIVVSRDAIACVKTAKNLPIHCLCHSTTFLEHQPCAGSIAVNSRTPYPPGTYFLV